MVKDFPQLDVGRARVVLVETTDDVLLAFRASSRAHARDTLRQRGVEVRLGRTVEEVTPDAVCLNGGQRVATRTLLWAAGIKGNPLVEQLGLPVGHATRPFHYRDKGIMATIGRQAAVTELPIGLRLRGTLGWLAWLGLHLVTLVGFRNRLIVLVNWAWNYLTWDRGARLILDPPPPYRAGAPRGARPRSGPRRSPLQR